MDESGFIRITDRLSRSSEIAGEMAPHMKIEALHVIEAIPTLGTGKTDLRAVRQLALDRSAVPASR